MHRSTLLLIFACAVLFLSSCAHDQQLVSIQIQPTTETFGDANTPVIADAGANVQLRALGTFIHPPVTKDITSQVTWVSNTPQIATVDANGLLTATGQACGDALISATVRTDKSAGNISSSGAIVTGSMTATVVCFTGNGGGGNSTLTVNLPGAGQGTVTSSPVGISCISPATSCSAVFITNNVVTLAETPNPGSTFAGWGGQCPSSSSTCAITMNSSKTVTVTFN